MKRLLSLTIAAAVAVSFVACDDYEYPKSIDGVWAFDQPDGTRDSLTVYSGEATLHIVDLTKVYDVAGPIDYFSNDGLGIMTIADPQQTLRIVQVQADCRNQCLVSGYGVNDFGRTVLKVRRIMTRQ